MKVNLKIEHTQHYTLHATYVNFKIYYGMKIYFTELKTK